MAKMIQPARQGLSEAGAHTLRTPFLQVKTSHWKETWDIVMLFLIIYSAIIVPFRCVRVLLAASHPLYAGSGVLVWLRAKLSSLITDC